MQAESDGKDGSNPQCMPNLRRRACSDILHTITDQRVVVRIKCLSHSTLNYAQLLFLAILDSVSMHTNVTVSTGMPHIISKRTCPP